MAGQRQAKLVSIPLGPGVLSNTTARAAKTRQNYVMWDRYRDCNWVRWHKLYPEKIGGWQFVSLGQQMLGACRGLHDWATFDSSLWVAAGTHLKLYLTNNQQLYDITPSRKSSTPTNPFATTNTQPLVTVTDAGHGANSGDYITVTGSTGSQGFATYDGSYAITVIDADTYTIMMGSNASGTSPTTGGTPTIVYDIHAGLQDNSFALLGYGIGTYSGGTYGTPRTSGTLARLRTWSLSNYGQDLIASYADGEIYWWKKSTWPGTVRAGLLNNAPTTCQRVLAESETGFIIAYGCTDLSSNYNSMLVRWSDNSDITVWTPASTNNAGNFQLQVGSKIVTALKVNQETLVWTDSYLYRQILGGSNVFGFYGVGKCQIAGPNAVVEVNGTAYAFGLDNMYSYEGTLSIMPCDVWETVFDNSNGPGFRRDQSEKVYAYVNTLKTEISWVYPSNTGNGECDRYVTYNWEDQIWYYGQLQRTAMADFSEAIGGPYGVNNGYLYQHETGVDAIEPGIGQVAIGWWIETLDLTTGGSRGDLTLGGSDARFAVGASDSGQLLHSWVPDWAYLTGNARLTVQCKQRPQDQHYVTFGPQVFGAGTRQIDLRSQGSQVKIRLDNYTANGQPSVGSSFRMGVLQVLASPYGHR